MPPSGTPCKAMPTSSGLLSVFALVQVEARLLVDVLAPGGEILGMVGRDAPERDSGERHGAERDRGERDAGERARGEVEIVQRHKLGGDDLGSQDLCRA